MKTIHNVRYTVTPNNKTKYDNLFTITTSFNVDSYIIANPVPFEGFMGNILKLSTPYLKVESSGDYHGLLNRYPKFKFVSWPEGEPTQPMPSYTNSNAKVLYGAVQYSFSYTVGVKSQMLGEGDCYDGVLVPDAYVLASRILKSSSKHNNTKNPIAVTMSMNAYSNDYLLFSEKLLGEYKVFTKNTELAVEDIARLIKRAGDNEPRAVCN